MLELSIYGIGAEYAFMYNGKRFYITISAEKLRGKGTLLNDFEKFENDIDDPDTMFQFEEWILDSLDDLMQQAAPTPEPGAQTSITLFNYFSAETFSFELINEQGKLSAIQRDYYPLFHGDSRPRTQIVDSSPELETSRNGAILRSSLPPVPIFRASQLKRVGEGLRDEEMSDVPKSVRKVGSDHLFFFKSGLKDHGHLREIQILSQMSGSLEFEAPFRTSKLVGVVVWDDNNDSLMGFLLDYINGQTLGLRVDGASIELKAKWIDQVEATVRRLHELSIVWGDVKADNVIINEDEDAVVIDFGGRVHTRLHQARAIVNCARGIC